MAVNPILVLQILTGTSLFFGHGLSKLRSTTETIKWFKKQGYGSIGGVIAIIVEGFASLLLILGIFPRIMAALIAITMLGAMVHHWKGKDPFKGGWEPAFLYFVAAVVILIGAVSPLGFML